MLRTMTNEPHYLQRLDALNSFQRRIAAGEWDQVTSYQTVADLALNVTGAEGAAVEEIDGDEMIHRACSGTLVAYSGLRLPIAESASGWVYRNNRTRVIDNADDDKTVKLPQTARAYGFVSGVIAPLYHEGKPYGTLKVIAAEPGRFAEEARYLLELASAMTAAALYNSLAYQAQLRRRALLLDALPALVAYLDTNLRYREVNAAYENLFNLSAEAICGLQVSELIGEAAYNETRAEMETALAGNSVLYEHEVTGGDGVPRSYRVNLVPDHAPDGAVQGLYVLVSDITEEHQATVDFLTGVANRRGLERQGAQALAAAKRYGYALSLVILDVDHFKQVNDIHGHLVGDEVLKTLTALLAQLTRHADILGRWGGEEFVLILPHTSATDAEHLAERIRTAVHAGSFPNEMRLTVSLGVSTLRADDDLRTLTDRADATLYRAKQAGRDSVMMADGDAVTPV